MTDAIGWIPIHKPVGCTSYDCIRCIKKLLSRGSKIGHGGTLDPFASGVLIILIGRAYTRQATDLLTWGKTYRMRVRLGISTDTYDCEGTIQNSSDRIPSQEEVLQALSFFQGEVDQIPPMFSAKKKEGRPLYEWARQGVSIERAPCKVSLQTTCLSYQYPWIDLEIHCSKGAYMRSIAHDLGEILQVGAHAVQLERTHIGSISLEQSIPLALFQNAPALWTEWLIQEELSHACVPNRLV